MFYAAPKEWIEQNMPDLATYQPEKTRIFYPEADGQIRFADRICGYYFSDRPWGRGEDERLVEGLDQEFVDKQSYLSTNIRNTLRAPDGWTFVSCDYAAQELRLGAINTKGKAFLNAFMNGEDVHLSTAKAMFGEEAVKANKKKLRSIAKGCNSVDAYYATSTGYKHLKDTDHILDANGNKQSFINVIEHRIGHRLYLSNGQILDVTDNHKFLDMSMLEPEFKEHYLGMQIPLLKTKNKHFSTQYDYTYNYTVKHHNQFGEYLCNKKINFKLTKELGYLIGIYLGDGYIYERNIEGLTICCNPTNADYLYSIMNSYKSSRKNSKGCTRIDMPNYSLLSITNTALIRFIREHFGYTKTKHIDLDLCYNSPLEFNIGLISGLIDSDGSAYSDQMFFGNTSELLTRTLSSLLAFVGIPATYSEKSYTYKGITKPFYKLTILDARLLDLHVEHKKKAFKNVISRYMGYKLKNVTSSTYQGKYYDKLNMLSKGLIKSLTCRAIEKYIPELKHNDYYPISIVKIEPIETDFNIMECETHYYEAEGYIQPNCNFSMQYGGSPQGLSRVTGVPLDEATNQYNAYMLAQADHFAVQNAQVRRTHQTLTEYSFFGLPVRLHNYYKVDNYSMQSAGERLAKNHRIQACLPYSTKIMTNKGYIPIGKLYDDRDQHFDTMVWNGFDWTHFTPVYKGKDILHKITFDNGKVLYCDSRHKLKVINPTSIDWTMLPDLKVGDAIAFSKIQRLDYQGNSPQEIIGEKSSSNVPGLTNFKYDTMTFNREDILDMCYMYGSILGDGNINPTKGNMSISMTWGYTKFNNISRFTKLLDKFNIYYKIKVTQPYLMKSGKMSHELRSIKVYCAPLVRAFKKLFGIEKYENTYTKRIHDITFTYDKDMISLILEGLHDTDGIKFNHSGNLNMCNAKLIQDIQLLQRLIGFNSKIKYNGSATYLRNTSTTYVDYLKTGIGEDNTLGQTLPYHNYVFKQLCKSNPYPRGTSKCVIVNKLLTTYGDKIGERCYLSTFRSICKELDIHFEDYDYSRIVSIENLQEPIDTYTLTTNNPMHQYDSEGVISKNTGADVLSIAFIKLWKNIFSKIKNPEDYVRFQITVHDEIDFIVRNDVIHIIIPEILKNMQCQMPDWEIPLTIGLSFGPTFGQQYEWEYSPDTFEVLGPKLEMPKKEEPKQEVIIEQPQEEKILLEF